MVPRLAIEEVLMILECLFRSNLSKRSRKHLNRKTPSSQLLSSPNVDFSPKSYSSETSLCNRFNHILHELQACPFDALSLKTMMVTWGQCPFSHLFDRRRYDSDLQISYQYYFQKKQPQNTFLFRIIVNYP